MNKTSVLDKCVVVTIHNTIWSGARHMRPEDIRLGDGGQMPPKDVATLGSKKICDPKSLNIFHAIDSRMHAACFAVGSQFLHGYMTSDTNLEALTAKLDAYVAEFEREKEAFLHKYDEDVEKWIATHQEFEAVIRRSVLPATEVKNRLSAGYAAYRIGYAPTAQTETALDNKVGGVCDTLYQEVETEARNVLQSAYSGNVTRRILQPIGRLLQKLDGMSFLDAGIGRLVAALQPTLTGLQGIDGRRFTASEVTQVLSIVNLLTSTAAMKKIAAGLEPFTAPDADDLWSSGPQSEIEMNVEDAFVGPPAPAPSSSEPVPENPTEPVEEEMEESFFL
jgi:hypothetical protein